MKTRWRGERVREQKMGGEKDVEERQKRDKKTARHLSRVSGGGGVLQTPLSSFPLEARSRKVTVGLQFWQTGGNYSYTHTHAQQQLNARQQLPDDSNLAVIKPWPAWTYKQKSQQPIDWLLPTLPRPCREAAFLCRHTPARGCAEKNWPPCFQNTHTSPLRPVQFLIH